MKSSGNVALVPLCQLASPLTTPAETPTRGFQLSDLQKIVSLTDLRILPDGRRVAVDTHSPTDLYRRRAGWMDRHLK